MSAVCLSLTLHHIRSRYHYTKLTSSPRNQKAEMLRRATSMHKMREREHTMHLLPTKTNGTSEETSTAGRWQRECQFRQQESQHSKDGQRRRLEWLRSKHFRLCFHARRQSAALAPAPTGPRRRMARDKRRPRLPQRARSPRPDARRLLLEQQPTAP